MALAGLVLVSGLAGCATEKPSAQDRETMLQAAGFRAVRATTPAQQQMLKTLPAERVSAVQRDGQVYFVYPIPGRKVLYLGRNTQYLAYQEFAAGSHEQALITQEMQAIDRFPSTPVWSAPIGDWDVDWDTE
jgi:hypothetical protein